MAQAGVDPCAVLRGAGGGDETHKHGDLRARRVANVFRPVTCGSPAGRVVMVWPAFR